MCVFLISFLSDFHCILKVCYSAMDLEFHKQQSNWPFITDHLRSTAQHGSLHSPFMRRLKAMMCPFLQILKSYASHICKGCGLPISHIRDAPTEKKQATFCHLCQDWIKSQNSECLRWKKKSNNKKHKEEVDAIIASQCEPPVFELSTC